MKVHTLNDIQKREIINELTRLLKEREEIVFAYLHGSFLTHDFRDIDVAIYLKEDEDVLYEVELGVELEKILGYPVDVRVLNSAPLTFRFKVIKDGLLLFSRDEKIRSNFEALTISEYHDFSYFRKRYRREVLGI
ncbi:Nucleotidyltransferase domain protein [Archaeoglobus fulgidus DSM 8774]|uniref:Nucleotidyltransferase domain protein n=1 Tax=Archaeoglobus fulgidus DSM 8774 TaxID=1344584 RepID=A0A075WEG7_ARCFL|nr:nucleotidyltransferase domain-containing protein [Archaeoglobus fulgidus]AIG98391.1 Nucleotidyltransferase domain protein [Archaeoglobus fulgidus DSM 8774]